MSTKSKLMLSKASQGPYFRHHQQLLKYFSLHLLGNPSPLVFAPINNQLLQWLSNHKKKKKNLYLFTRFVYTTRCLILVQIKKYSYLLTYLLLYTKGFGKSFGPITSCAHIRLIIFKILHIIFKRKNSLFHVKWTQNVKSGGTLNLTTENIENSRVGCFVVFNEMRRELRWVKWKPRNEHEQRGYLSSNHSILWIIRFRWREQCLYRKECCFYSQCWTPLVFQYVQANSTILTAYVRVPSMTIKHQKKESKIPFLLPRH